MGWPSGSKMNRPNKQSRQSLSKGKFLVRDRATSLWEKFGLRRMSIELLLYTYVPTFQLSTLFCHFLQWPLEKFALYMSSHISEKFGHHATLQQ